MAGRWCSSFGSCERTRPQQRCRRRRAWQNRRAENPHPGRNGPVVRNVEGRRQLAMLNWSMPTASNVQFQATKARAATGRPISASKTTAWCRSPVSPSRTPPSRARRPADPRPYAGYSDFSRRNRDLALRSMGRSQGATTSPARRSACHRRQATESRSRVKLRPPRENDKTEEEIRE